MYSNPNNNAKQQLRWKYFLRYGKNGTRVARPNLFYSIYVSNDGSHIVEVGEPLPVQKNRFDVPNKEGCVTVFPIYSDGTEGSWNYNPDGLRKLIDKGYIKILNRNDKNNFSFSFLTLGEQKKVEQGLFKIIGRDTDNSIIVDDSNYQPLFVPNTVWNIPSHDAGYHGTQLISKLLPDRKFPFPKSLYAVEDCLRFFVADKPDALIVDFFAGSGTTCHATMLLNHLDGGHRRCISITNNEIGLDNEKELTKAGLRPTDEEWQSKGIARYITWERIKSAVTGINTKGEPIKGDFRRI